MFAAFVEDFEVADIVVPDRSLSIGWFNRDSEKSMAQ